jgi:hypothetical protein
VPERWFQSIGALYVLIQRGLPLNVQRISSTKNFNQIRKQTGVKIFMDVISDILRIKGYAPQNNDYDIKYSICKNLYVNLIIYTE